MAKLIALAFALGRLGSAGIGVGVSLHDSAIAILRRFGRPDYLKDICEQAIRGEAVLCIGASEVSGGSDLQIVETEVRSARDGFEVRGVKKFVSLSPVADLHARVDLLRHGLNGIAADGRLELRAAAAAKVTAARLGEEVLSECMHIFVAQGIWRTKPRSADGGAT